MRLDLRAAWDVLNLNSNSSALMTENDLNHNEAKIREASSRWASRFFHKALPVYHRFF